MSLKKFSAFIFLISLGCFGGEPSNSTMEELKRILVENYYFSSDEAQVKSEKLETFKKYLKKQGSDFAHFKTLSLNYFDSSKIKHYSNEYGETTETILAYCLFSENREIKKSCGSEEFRKKIDLLTEEKYPGQDSGHWAVIMSDLYEVSFIIEENLDSEVVEQVESEAVNSPIRENLKDVDGSGSSAGKKSKEVIKE